MQRKMAIILGDSSHNTLSAVRSLGEAQVSVTLVLKCEEDICNLCQSKYLKKSDIIKVKDVGELHEAFDKINGKNQLLITTFDEGAMWVDSHEKELSKKFVTPCRGAQIGPLFDKAAQCELAIECGLTVPRSIVYKRGDDFPYGDIAFPLLLKPLVSTNGEKSDIHICHNASDVESALQSNSRCDKFIVQEFIEKEYELDCIGVSTDDDVIISGAVRKIRHYPPLIGAGAYGIFIPEQELNIDMEAISRFIRKSNYHGPFSIELLHTASGKNYFMEVNFRNEGLAYASTVAGANLHAIYAGAAIYAPQKVRRIYMMNYSIDFLYVKNGELTLRQWLRDLFRTRCFINFSLRDPMPVISYYLTKIRRKCPTPTRYNSTR